MGFLIDTNVLSEFRKGPRADKGVQDWFAHANDEELFVSVLTLGEIRRGIENIRRRDPVSAQQLQFWLAELQNNLADRILPITPMIADRWGCLGVPNPIPVIDGLLAATALEHGLTLVTRNVNDVKQTGVAWLNPFEKDAFKEPQENRL
jgi:predicted nucleic acid-binding protein